MGRTRQTEIKESLEELKRYKTLVVDYKSSKKLDLLLAIKASEHSTLSAIGTQLGIKADCLYRWLRLYKNTGVDNYLRKEIRSNSKSRIITQEIHDGLVSRLNDPENCFLGFWDAQQWIKETYNVDIQYQLLWHYITNHLKGKLKMPRRSNIKKDPEATEAFLKTP